MAMADIQARTDALSVGDESWKILRAGEILAVPGQVGMLDAGVPWFRSTEELDDEYERLRRHGRLLPTGDYTYKDLTGGLRALIGVRATARWCLGKAEKTPLSSRPALVTGTNIRSEMELATEVMDGRTGAWEHATGVGMWLCWVTGATDKPVYLSW
jgi:hypothetical protein